MASLSFSSRRRLPSPARRPAPPPPPPLPPILRPPPGSAAPPPPPSPPLPARRRRRRRIFPPQTCCGHSGVCGRAGGERLLRRVDRPEGIRFPQRLRRLRRRGGLFGRRLRPLDRRRFRLRRTFPFGGNVAPLDGLFLRLGGGAAALRRRGCYLRRRVLRLRRRISRLEGRLSPPEERRDRLRRRRRVLCGRLLFPGARAAARRAGSPPRARGPPGPMRSGRLMGVGASSAFSSSSSSASSSKTASWKSSSSSLFFSRAEGGAAEDAARRRRLRRLRRAVQGLRGAEEPLVDGGQRRRLRFRSRTHIPLLRLSRSLSAALLLSPPPFSFFSIPSFSNFLPIPSTSGPSVASTLLPRPSPPLRSPSRPSAPPPPRSSWHCRPRNPRRRRRAPLVRSAAPESIRHAFLSAPRARPRPSRRRPRPPSCCPC